MENVKISAIEDFYSGEDFISRKKDSKHFLLENILIGSAKHLTSPRQFTQWGAYLVKTGVITG